MTRLRNAGTAFIFTLFLALALCTTSAFARSAQMKKSASIHAAIVAYHRLGGAPFSAYPFAPTVPFAPVMHVQSGFHPMHTAPAMRAQSGFHPMHMAPVMRTQSGFHPMHMAPVMHVHSGFHPMYMAPAMRTQSGFHPMHMAPVMHVHSGFHPMYMAPAMRAQSGFHPMHIIHHGFYRMHRATVHHMHTAATAVAIVRFFGYGDPCSDFPDAAWHFWWFSLHPWLP